MIYQPFPIGRVCRYCGVWKPYALLKKGKHLPDGVDHLCMECHRIQAAKRYHEKREEILEKGRQKRQANPERYREYDRRRSRQPERQSYRLEYGKRYYREHKAEIDAKNAKYAREHPEVFLRSGKKWVAANRDKVNAKNRRYQKRHPENAAKHVKLARLRHPETKKVSDQRRRARKHNLPDTFSAADQRRMMDYFDHRCAVCDRPAGLWHTIAADHWIPLSDPNCPGTVKENMVPLCHSQRLGDDGCNNTKWKTDPVEWLTERFGTRKAKRILKRIEDYFRWVRTQEFE